MDELCFSGGNALHGWIVLISCGWHLVSQILYHSNGGRQVHIAYLVGT